MTDDERAPSTTQAGDTRLGLPVAQSADPIDQVVRLAPKWTLYVLGACALMIAAALVWAFAGQITQTLSRPGALRDNGYHVVEFTTGGTVETVHVQPGDRVTVGSLVVELEDGSGLVAPLDGYVSSLYMASGAEVAPGDAAISITDLTVPDEVLTLLPASMVGTIEAGLAVEVEFSNAPASTYGFAKGWIESVGAEPVTTAELARTLEVDPEVVELAVGDEPGLAAVIGLESDLDNPSTLVWTVGTGPDFVPAQGTPVTVNVILSSRRPIDILFPGEGTAGSADGVSP